MNFNHKDLEIDASNPFKNCKLDREKYANALTSIAKIGTNGFVLAINNEWGTGKTTFVKMWRQKLENEGFKTLFFNAWENDFDDNPMVAFMSELKPLVKFAKSDSYKTLLKRGAKITKSALPALLRAFIEKHIDSKTLVDALSESGNALSEILETEIDEYADRKVGIQKFRDQLEKFVKEASEVTPIVFIIDELDRCRPNYAVAVLEQIKHFFSVKGIIFVLSIDKLQLGHAIQGVYGSENLNVDGYLKRFFDIEYTLPSPDKKLFCKYLFDYYNFNAFFRTAERLKYSNEFGNEERGIIDFFSEIIHKENVSLRMIERIFSHSRIALHSFPENNYVFPQLFMFLIYIKHTNVSFYDEIVSLKISIINLMEIYLIYRPSHPDKYFTGDFWVIGGTLLKFYNNCIKYDEREDLDVLLKDIKSVGAYKDGMEDLLRNATRNTRQGLEDVKLSYLTDKISLLSYVD